MTVVLTGADLTSATLQFQGASGIVQEPTVVLQFNAQGAQIFSQVTSQNVGKIFGMFLDGTLLSAHRGFQVFGVASVTSTGGPFDLAWMKFAVGWRKASGRRNFLPKPAGCSKIR